MSIQVEKFVDIGKKIVAVGRNYRDHCAELGNDVPKKPLLFMKPPSSYLKENTGPILIPRGCCSLHHEVELAVVMGKECRDVEELNAMKYVAGYALALDMTARDFQLEAKAKGNPWEMAKCFDTALPISRFITNQELTQPFDAHIWCKVNGNMRQDSNTSEMVFTIPSLLSYISKYFTLHPGDVVLTGTPAGVGQVNEGDVIECGLGSILRMNFIVASRK